MDKKECSKCGLKTIGTIPICYRCNKKEYYKEYYKKEKETIKARSLSDYYSNKDIRLQQMKEYAEKNLDKMKEISKRFHQKNRETQLKKFKEYYEVNKVELNKKSYQSKKQRLKTDIQFRLKENLSTRARMAILNHKGIKNSSSIELLGADIQTVRKHIEEKFTEGMSWDNWGNKTSKKNGYDNYWEVDHEIPCDLFDLTIEEQQKICFNYKNLQPLWYIENNHKKNKILVEVA